MCKTIRLSKRRYLLTLQVRSSCLLDLQSRIVSLFSMGHKESQIHQHSMDKVLHRKTCCGPLRNCILCGSSCDSAMLRGMFQVQLQGTQQTRNIPIVCSMGQ